MWCWCNGFLCFTKMLSLELSWCVCLLLARYGYSLLCLLVGVGFGMVIISAVVCVYYNVIIAWTIYYFVLSFAWELPWSTCGNDWNTCDCYMRSSNSSRFSVTNKDCFNGTDRANVTLNKTRSPSEEFFELVFCQHFCRLLTTVLSCILTDHYSGLVSAMGPAHVCRQFFEVDDIWTG